MARTIIERLNEGGDAMLGARRQLIKRVLDFEDFSHCYPEDVAKAKAAVSDIRKIVNVNDTFTRMKDEKEAQDLAHRREAPAPSRRGEEEAA
jgi:hypothetical protein